MNLFDKKQNEIMKESLKDLVLISWSLFIFIIIVILTSFLSIIF